MLLQDWMDFSGLPSLCDLQLQQVTLQPHHHHGWLCFGDYTSEKVCFLKGTACFS